MATFNIFCFCILSILLAPFYTHAASYKGGEKVPLYVNKVGPYFNPQETYHYYSLPVCRPEKVEHRSLTLGEVLDGDRMAVALHEVNFKEQKENVKLCTVTLKEKQVQVLREAIEDLYYFEFVLVYIILEQLCILVKENFPFECKQEQLFLHSGECKGKLI
ncbi:transmembrane 9 superfamily member 1-like [Stylophora pistillata]|uniref:transmembrane 9 superfamily member 1-like n=1 Tax=Stylophora pistillata TaxID=50429 RepID=UPI000C03AF25|nr:transmembrane 9 superfamily member 1-like [Stylophora pistillata]